MALFVLFVCAGDASNGWEKIPSKPLDCLLAGLLCYMCEKNPFSSNILSESDPQHAGLRGTRDTVAPQLRADGVGASVKHAEVISREEEELLWSSDCGVMGVNNPHALGNAVFFCEWKKSMSSWWS